MGSSSDNQTRIDRVRVLLRENNLDGYLALNTSDIRWLTGWTQLFDLEQAHAVLLTQDVAHLHSDSRYSNVMRERNTEGLWQISDELIALGGYLANLLAPNRGTQAAPFKLGIEADIALNRYRALVAALAEGFELVEKPGLLSGLRAVKDSSEIALHKQAQAITDAAFAHMIEWLKPGQSEREAQAELEYSLQRLGGEGIAFGSIVASGSNSANPHAVSSQRRFEQGDFLVLDFGAKYHDYCADMTRTVIFGEPSEQQRCIYDTVLRAHETAKAAIAPGKTGKALHELALSVITEAGFGSYFTHGLGHGVGIDVHEEPRLAAQSTSTLVQGNVVTVEPGIYLPGCGGVRIEDFGVVTATGFEVFTQAPHELIVL
ncbi:MAG: Xaa-Pro peptidase family protein [Coriobacteriales bacterium]|jgi:Xaa-Pro aminopeptidase|nr:Xaa-Pro peptidase family protein [Coriobacteriales bacterium]